MPIIQKGGLTPEQTEQVNSIPQLQSDVDNLKIQSFYEILSVAYDVVNNSPDIVTTPLAPNKGMRIGGIFTEPFNRFGIDWLPGDIIIRLSDNSGYIKLDNTSEINDTTSNSSKTTYSTQKLNQTFAQSVNNQYPSAGNITLNSDNVLEGTLNKYVTAQELIDIANSKSHSEIISGNPHGSTTANISDSVDKRYVTDANLTALSSISGSNTGDETTATIKTKLGAATSSQDGYLTSTDWNTFNAKIGAGINVPSSSVDQATYIPTNAVVTNGDTQQTYNNKILGIFNSLLAIGTALYAISIPNIPGQTWLEANGAVISRTTYSTYFALTSTAFGAGDGSTTYAIPDARGRVLGAVGQGSGLTNRVLGASVGVESITLSVANLPPHTHLQNSHSHTFGLGYIVSYSGNGFALSTPQAGGGQQTTNAETATNQNTGSGTAINIMNPTLYAGKYYIRVL